MPLTSSSSSSLSSTTFLQSSNPGPARRRRRKRQLQDPQQLLLSPQQSYTLHPTPQPQSNVPTPIQVFAWYGGGGCRGCYCDCNDQRRNLQANDPTMVWGTTEWFLHQYSPQLESSIKNATFAKVVPNHGHCLGPSPNVTVQIKRISITQLKSQLQCYKGRLMSFLPSMSLTNIAVMDHNCPTCVTIDFSKNSNSSILPGGTIISDQWKDDNVIIQVTYPFLNQTGDARILDTSNAVCLKQHHSEDFGSPNQNCPGGGIGLGNGGSVRTIGANCKPIGSEF
jgi:hypothetical protein